MISFSKTFVVLAAAAAVAAEGGPAYGSSNGQNTLSKACVDAVARLGANDDANECLAIPQFTNIFANPDISVVGAVNTWLTAMCSAQPCTESTVSGDLTAAVQACPEVALWMKVPPGKTVDGDAIAKQYYPVFRKSNCLKEGSTLCSTQTLANYERVVGTLTYSKLQPLVEGNTSTLPASAICTNCNKAVYNILFQTFGPEQAQTSNSGKLCGADFVNGANPPGIS